MQKDIITWVLRFKNINFNNFPVAIFGTGPAGITAALELEKKNIKCLLIEAGDENYSKTSQAFYKGKVIGDQNDKTIVVLVKRKYSHPFYGKVITSSKKYHAHDEKNKFKIGDNVQIIESKSYSKKKKWEAINK